MTKEILQSRLELYLEAERKIVGGAASYKIGDRELTRANLSQVRRAIEELTAQIELLTLKNGRVKRVVFYD